MRSLAVSTKSEYIHNLWPSKMSTKGHCIHGITTCNKVGNYSIANVQKDGLTAVVYSQSGKLHGNEINLQLD